MCKVYVGVYRVCSHTAEDWRVIHTCEAGYNRADPEGCVADNLVEEDQEIDQQLCDECREKCEQTIKDICREERENLQEQIENIKKKYEKEDKKYNWKAKDLDKSNKNAEENRELFEKNQDTLGDLWMEIKSLEAMMWAHRGDEHRRLFLFRLRPEDYYDDLQWGRWLKGQFG